MLLQVSEAVDPRIVMPMGVFTSRRNNVRRTGYGAHVIENGVVQAALDISNFLQLNGVATDGARVRSGGELHLRGVMNGNLQVDPGGSVQLTGVFDGTVHIKGFVSHSGVLKGRVILDGGEFVAAVGSVIHRGTQPYRLTDDGSLEPLQDGASVVITDRTPRFRLSDTGEFLPYD